MDLQEFRNQGHQFIDWMAEYLSTVRDYPVRSQVKPGDILKKLPSHPPAMPENMEDIFSDFKQIILPGITHWQSPNFFAYFPANSSLPSILAEMLTATLGAQCMIWETSPAAAELEERVLDWIRQMIGIPGSFSGVIQDTASTATLTALLTARERTSGYQINDHGYSNYNYRVYCSAETHSSIEKGVKIAGLGKSNLVKVPVDSQFRLAPEALEKAIISDLARGYKPLCIVATLGSTGSTSIDPLAEIAAIAQRYHLWLHVDAAFAGSALLLEEYRWMIKGIELADSFVFNPHKWLFTNFDLSAYFVKDREALIRTFSINPEYLKTATSGQVNDYRDWGIQLGRRFRALKLWFVIRSFGLEGLKEKIRNHIRLAELVEKWIVEGPDFELLAPRTLNLVCFRYNPGPDYSPGKLNELNERLLKFINDTGKIYLSHTKLNDCYTLRMVIGQTEVNANDVKKAWKLINDSAGKISLT